jgi:hypothetical protein
LNSAFRILHCYADRFETLAAIRSIPTQTAAADTRSRVRRWLMPAFTLSRAGHPLRRPGDVIAGEYSLLSGGNDPSQRQLPSMCAKSPRPFLNVAFRILH